MPDVRNRPTRARSAPVLFVAACALALVGTLLGRASISGESTGTPDAEATPLSQATADDVTISLIAFSHSDEEELVVDLRVQNGGAEPVGIEAELLSLEVTDSAGDAAARPMSDADPALPCSIAAGAHVNFALTFTLESGDEPVHLTVGIAEVQRSGAKVILPFAPGAGASAIGGTGAPGASAGGDASSGGTPTPTFSATPGASPEAGGCQT